MSKVSLVHARNSRLYRSAAIAIEYLEDRTLFANGTLYHPTRLLARSPGGFTPMASASPQGLTPAQVRAAYGINNITFGNLVGDGAGQTIAIIDAYDAPTIDADLAAFDQAFGIPAPPSFVRVAQDGTTNYPGTDPNAGPNGSWEGETALDVEWAHALAPKANILLVEANSAYDVDLWAAVDYARNQPGVSVITMSLGGPESPTITSDDFHFTTPSGHQGVTFFASSGDSGAYDNYSGKNPEYPASSPNVVAVGGTFLTVGGTGGYVSETAWGNGTNSDIFGGGGGGISVFEAQPSYQQGFVTQSTLRRTTPDISFVADPASGVAVYNSFDNGTATPWEVVGGTSLSAPCWGALAAIANQGRAAAGLGTLDGRTQFLPQIYGMSSVAFHDITSGNNGYAAGPGYDLATGRGTPIANVLIPALAGSTTIPPAPPPNPNAPTNDNFVNARQLSGSNLAVSGVNKSATKQQGEPNHAGNVGGRSVWYRWTAPVKASTTVSLAGSGFDTTLGVYTGSAVGALTPVVSNNDASATNRASSVTFTPTAGKVYYFAVDGYNNGITTATGTIIFSLKQAGVSTPSVLPPKNDNFGSATGMTGSAVTLTWSNYGATRQTGEPNIASNPGGRSVWWSWTAPASGATTITLAGSTFDTLLGIYRGTTVSGLTLVTSNNDEAPGMVSSKVTFNAIKGASYKIVVDGNNFSAFGAAYGTIKMKLTSPIG